MKRILTFFSQLFTPRRNRLSVILTSSTDPDTGKPAIQASFYDERWSEVEPMGFKFFSIGNNLVNAISAAVLHMYRIATTGGFAEIGYEERL